MIVVPKFLRKVTQDVLATYLEHLDEDGADFEGDTVDREAVARYAMGRANNLHKLLEQEMGIVNGNHKFIQVNPDYVLPTKEEMTKKYQENFNVILNAF